MFEMQKYFYTLDEQGQNQAIEFLSQSVNPLQNKVADVFRGLQAMENEQREGRGIVLADDSEFLKAHPPLDTDLIIDGKNEIGVHPNPTALFVLDEQPVFSLAGGPGYHTQLHDYLGELKDAASGLFRNRDAANLFGSMSNALNASENVFLSADHVLHYHHIIEKARKTIDFVNPPTELKSALNSLLEQAIAWQNTKQSNSIINNKKMISHNTVATQARDAVRLGSAAQVFNQTLMNGLKFPTASLLTSESLIMRGLMEQPDLIRFGSDKIREALEFYRQDDVLYDQALNRPSVLPEPPAIGVISDVDQKVFDASKQYALKVIGEIQGYISTQQT